MLRVGDAMLSRMCFAVKVVGEQEACVEQKLVLRATLHAAPRYEVSRHSLLCQNTDMFEIGHVEIFPHSDLTFGNFLGTF